MAALGILGVTFLGVIVLGIVAALLSALWKTSAWRYLVGAAALAGGVVALMIGINRLADPPHTDTPTCGGQEMRPDQLCQTYSRGSGLTGTADYHEQTHRNDRDQQILSYLVTGGGIVLIVGGFRAFKRARELRERRAATTPARSSRRVLVTTSELPPPAAESDTPPHLVDELPALAPLIDTAVPPPPAYDQASPRATPVAEEVTALVPSYVHEATTRIETPAAPPPGPALSFDTTGLQPVAGGWVDPVTGDDFRVSELTGSACPLPLERFEQVRRWLAEGQSRAGCLVEAFRVTAADLPAMFFVVKAPDRRPGSQVPPGRPAPLLYLVSVVIPRSGRFVQLNAIFPAGRDTGHRDALIGLEIAAADGPAALYPPHPYAPGLTSALPYSLADEARFDARFPDHPLSRARRWVDRTLSTMRVAPQFAALPPFTG